MDSTEILVGLIWFCLVVWYFTADILGIFCSFFLSLAIFVFSFLLVIFYNWYQEDLSHFRATRYTSWSKKHLHSAVPFLCHTLKS